MDMEFVVGEFLKDCLPREKQYLYKYFDTIIRRVFVRYMHVFGDHTYFVEHTGCLCTRRNQQALAMKLREIEEAHRIAKSQMNLELLERIEKGDWK